MKNISLFILGIIYLLLTVRVDNSIVATFKATAPQFVSVSSISLVVSLLIISIVQLSGGKNKVAWNRRFQLFLTIGIVMSFGLGLVEYFDTTHSEADEITSNKALENIQVEKCKNAGFECEKFIIGQIKSEKISPAENNNGVKSKTCVEVSWIVKMGPKFDWMDQHLVLAVIQKNDKYVFDEYTCSP